jgi:hypothetical protein
MRGVIVSLALIAAPALAQDPFGMAKQLAGGAATKQVETEVNKKLLAEARKNQCSFKTDSDELVPGCDKKLKNLTNVLVEAKKRLDSAGLSNYKFEVSGHTDTTGAAAHNKELSGKRATVIVRSWSHAACRKGRSSPWEWVREAVGQAGRHRRQEGKESPLRGPGAPLNPWPWIGLQLGQSRSRSGLAGQA